MMPEKAHDPDRCMKCGFCMSVCPIYTIDHVETHVARGRNMLIGMARDGRLPRDKSYLTGLSHCLLCRRCETVCLAGLSPAEITVQARREYLEQRPPNPVQRLVNRAMVNHRPALAKIIGMAAVFPGISPANGKPLRHMMEAAALLSGSLSLPSARRHFLSHRIRRLTPPPVNMEPRGRVGIFPGCVFEFFLPDIGCDIVRAISGAGFEVIYPKGLSCCGTAVYAAGDIKNARKMVRRNIEILAGFDRVVTGCATCGSALKSYGNWLGTNDPLHEDAVELAEKTIDFSIIMNEARPPAPLEKENGAPVKVTYHDPCHLKWHQGIADAPRQVLSSIPGVQYVEMNGADSCCGMGGTFGLVHGDIGRKLQDIKIDAIAQSGAQIVATSCPGCLLSLRAGIRRHGLRVKAVHIGELLAGSCVSGKRRADGITG